jgi:FeS assembly SUF system protein
MSSNDRPSPPHLPVIAPEPEPELAARPATRAVVASDAPAPVEIDRETLRQCIIEQLKRVRDPEIPVNIYDLGLIYRVDIDGRHQVVIAMTLTAPACPVAGELVETVAERVAGIAGVRRCTVDLVWEPAWTPQRMTEAAKLELGLL